MAVCRLTADDARSVTAYNDVSGMNFTLAANTTYVVQFNLMVTSNATTVGVQYQLTFGGTITRSDWNLLHYSSATAMGMIQVTNDTSSPFTFAATASGGTVGHQNQIVGTIEVGASGGTLQLQHASETASLTTILRGSYGVCVPA
jgi:hypothetical protein